MISFRLANPAMILLSAAAMVLFTVFAPGPFSPDGSVLAREISTDDPPVDFRVFNYSHRYVGLTWNAPRGRGITGFVINRYEHNGNEFVSSGTNPLSEYRGKDDLGDFYSTYGDIEVEPNTLYRYDLMLTNSSDTVILEASVTVRTSPDPSQGSTDARLDDLTLSGVEYYHRNPFFVYDVFFPSVISYMGRVANDVTETTVTPTVHHSGASYVIKLNGVPDADGVIPLAVGSNTITIEVTAEDGITSRTYTVTVTRAESTDDPPSDPVSTDDTPSDPKSTVTDPVSTDDTPSDPKSTITDPVSTDATLSDTKSTITDPVSTDDTLSGLTLSGIDIGTFDAATTTYVGSAANDVTETTVTPTVHHSGASYVIKLNGVPDADGVIPLAVGSNTITIEVTAEDGITSRTYTVTVTIPHSLEKVSGDSQEGPAGTQLAEPFVVLASDENGVAMAGVVVTFSVSAGEGMLSSTTEANPCAIEPSKSSTTATTDANGRAAIRLTLGSEPGTNTVEATVAGESETFTATATEQAVPYSLEKVCGDDQEGTVGALLPEPFVVSVSDEDGAAIAGVAVSFAVTVGEGTLLAATATTDVNGRARTWLRLTLGSELGTNTVEATLEGLESVTFTATWQELPLAGFLDAFWGSGKRVGLPDSPQLAQNAPNPFNSQTVISYFLDAPGPVRVEVFALTGQRVAVLHQGSQKAGYHRIRWGGRDAAGHPLASGVYLYRMVTTESVLTRKLTLLR